MEQPVKRTSYMRLVDMPFGYWTFDGEDFARWDWALTYTATHHPEPSTPLGVLDWVRPLAHAFWYSTEKVSHPFSKGLAIRVSPDGHVAMTCAIAPTPQEAREREPLFRQSMAPFFGSFDELWGDFRHKGKVGSYLRQIQEDYARIGAFDLETWSADPEKFINKLEMLSNGDLFDLRLETEHLFRRHVEIHHEIMYVTFTMYIAFEGLVMELFGFADTDPRFQKLIQGFDNKLYECDRELWHLARLAADLNLVDAFKEIPEAELVSKLRETQDGRKWLEEFHRFLKFYGRRSAQLTNTYKPTWYEDPAPVLTIVKNYLSKGLIDYDAERRKIAEEREKTVSELLEKVPEARKGEFQGLLKAAQTAYCWTEDHHYWIEQLGLSSLRYIALEMGKRLYKADAVAEPDDIFFFNPDEIWAIFLPAAISGRYDFRDFVEHRKAAWKAALDRTPPPNVTGKWVGEEVKDPTQIKIFGLGAMPAPAEKVDMFGYPGSPGVVEGIARVVTDVSELHRVESGSILITSGTNPAWTPIFTLIGGIVTDHGGTLSHPAIVSREYGIPAVVGTGNATRKIRDGQRIRVDGNKGYVWILS